MLLLLCHLLIAPHRPTRCRSRSAVWRAWPSVRCWHETREAARVQSDCWNGMLINMTLTFPRTDDSHRNARNYRIDSQTPENTSHFSMRITIFSSLTRTHTSLLLASFWIWWGCWLITGPHSLTLRSHKKLCPAQQPSLADPVCPCSSSLLKTENSH